MTHDFRTSSTGQDESDLLDELEVRCRTNVAAVRASASHRVRARIEVWAGNACDRQAMIAEVSTSELCDTGLTGLAVSPVMVGSVFLLRFDERVLDVPPTLAVCSRCAMLGDRSFEVQFRFTSPLDVEALFARDEP